MQELIKKVVYIGPKYIDPADPSCNIIVPDNHITVGSLTSSGLTAVKAYYWDETYRAGKQAENTIVGDCYEYQPDVVVLGGLAHPLFNIEQVLACLYELRIPTVYLWWDHTSPQNQQLAEKLAPLVSLNVIMDMTTPAPTAYPDKFIQMWYPLDRRLFYDAHLERDIDVCFLGTILPAFVDRVHYLSLLEKQGYKILVRTGVYRDNPLTIAEYANLLQRSKIALNFTMLPQYNTHQSKTRTAEVLHCGGLLLESANPHTAKRFEDGVDYVAFSDIESLTAKIAYYLQNEQERQEIANCGCRKVHKCYNEVIFWQEIFAKLAK